MLLEQNDNNQYRQTPAQVVIVRDASDPETDAFVDLLRQAVEGDADTYTGYVSESLGIGIPVREPSPPGDNQKQLDALLGAAAKTIVVEIRPKALKRKKHDGTSAPEWRLLRNAIKADPDLTLIQTHVPDDVAVGKKQANQTKEGGVEPGLRPLATTLGVLEALRVALQSIVAAREDQAYQGASSQNSDSNTLFISHAKADGAVTAVAVADFCRRVNTWMADALVGTQLEFFYDAESIPLGSDWATELDRAGRTSVLVALRTDQYETRFWCREEFRMAEENIRPIVVADLRKSLTADGGSVPFDSATRVRVSDGNTARIVLHAVAAHLRQLKLKAQIVLTRGPAQFVFVLPRQPTIASIRGIECVVREPEVASTKARAHQCFVVYPGGSIPKFDRDLYEGCLQKSRGGHVSVCTVDEWEEENVI